MNLSGMRYKNLKRKQTNKKLPSCCSNLGLKSSWPAVTVLSSFRTCNFFPWTYLTDHLIQLLIYFLWLHHCLKSNGFGQVLSLSLAYFYFFIFLDPNLNNMKGACHGQIQQLDDWEQSQTTHWVDGSVFWKLIQQPEATGFKARAAITM